MILIIIIAIYVNRKRDASGQISFIDKKKTGIIGVRLFKIEQGRRQNVRLLPLYVADHRLLLNNTIQLAAGEYEAKAYWKEKAKQTSDSVFEAQPIDQEKVYSLSGIVRFKLNKQHSIGFNLNFALGKLRIDSPHKDLLEINAEKNKFPLLISDTSLKRPGTIFSRSNQKKVWILPLTDEQIVLSINKDYKAAQRKLDVLTIKNQELKTNLDQTLSKLKKYSGKV